MTIEIHPFSPEFLADPYPYFERLHAEAPVFWNEPYGFWMITKYDDVVAAAKNIKLFSSSAGPASGLVGGDSGQPSSIIASDPPLHTRLRQLVTMAFTPRRIAEMEPRIREIAVGLLDDLQAGTRPGGTFDMLEAFSAPLPVTVIAEILGAPAERHKEFKRWSDAAMGGAVPNAGDEVMKIVDEFQDYLTELMDDRRAHPRNDPITGLVEAADPESGKLTDEEIHQTILTILVAGNETTTNLINNGVVQLAHHPETYQEVVKDPTLIPGLIEEVLRHHCPVQGIFRKATEDVEIRGQTIHAGDHVWLLFGAAGRDAEHFTDPGRFDIHRQPNDHIGFGFGIHFCLGAPLARLEGRIAFEEILARLPELSLGPEEPVMFPAPIVHGYSKLPLTMGGG